MGGCATKPKVSNPETTSRDIPIEPNEKEVEDVVVVAESSDNKAIVVEQDDNIKGASEIDRVKEIVDEEVDQRHKRRSLSHLFKENEEGNNPAEIEKSTSVVLIKPEEEASKNNDKASEEILEDKKIVVSSTTTTQEVENSKVNNNNNNSDQVEELVKESGNEKNAKENQIPLDEGKIPTDVKERSDAKKD